MPFPFLLWPHLRVTEVLLYPLGFVSLFPLYLLSVAVIRTPASPKRKTICNTCNEECSLCNTVLCDSCVRGCAKCSDVFCEACENFVVTCEVSASFFYFERHEVLGASSLAVAAIV